jgi:branched-subunit amino acid transport protein
MNIKILILGMVFVTMIPRIIPFYIFDIKKLPKFVRIMLDMVPFTVFGALILPGGLNEIANEVTILIICLTVAAIISWFKGGVAFPIVGSVGTAIILKLLEFY